MNGWTTFETWKIWHEVFSQMVTPTEPMEATDCLSYIEEVLDLHNDDVLKNALVYSWLTKVNWTEIADALNELIDEQLSPIDRMYNSDEWVQAQKDAQ